METRGPIRRVPHPWVFLGIGLTLVLALPQAVAAASAPASQLTPWVTNGRVNAIAALGDTVYIGGGFTLVGPNTGTCVAIDRTTGRLIPGFPRVAGPVQAFIPDDSGGWYVGGSIVGVGGLPRSGVAHVMADGSVADWTPNPDGPVEAMVLSGNTLYVGGAFGRIGGALRSNLAAIDVRTGLATNWRADANATVRALLMHGSSLYVGGDFSFLGGQPRLGIAEVALHSGRVTSWDPGAGGPGPGSIRTLARVGGTIYAGGSFRWLGTEPRSNLAAISAGSGKVMPWNPNVADCNCNDRGVQSYVQQIVPSGDGTLYVAGHFTLVAGADRGGLAEVDLTTGLPTTWDPHPGWYSEYSPPYVFCVALGEKTLFVGSATTTIGGEQRSNFAEVDRVSGAATDWAPQGIGAPTVLVVSGGRVYAAGKFLMLDAQKRNALAAIDVRTGQLTDWNPGPEDFGYVESMIAGDGRVYVGGSFDRLGGEDRLQLGALDAVSGQALDWRADVDGLVSALALAGDRLYLGGDFKHVSGQPRSHVAAVGSATGHLVDWDPNVNGDVAAIVPDHGEVYLAGSFRSVGGTPHACVAAVDSATGIARTWGDIITSQERAFSIAVGESTVAVGGDFGVFLPVGIGDYHQGIKSIDKATGTRSDWFAEMHSNRLASAYPYALIRVGNVLYAGGIFDSVAGESRGGIAALDASSGKVLDWNPELGGIDGAVVHRILAHESLIYAGGDIDWATPDPAHNYVVLTPALEQRIPRTVLPTRGGKPVFTVAPSPARAGTTVRFSLASGTTVSLALFDVRGRRIISALEGTPVSAGPHEFAIETSSLASGIYFCRLDIPGASLTRKLLVLGR
jgi:hypothetical protein